MCAHVCVYVHMIHVHVKHARARLRAFVWELQQRHAMLERHARLYSVMQGSVASREALKRHATHFSVMRGT